MSGERRFDPRRTLEPLRALESARGLLHQTDGVLTRDLVLEPGGFGLGMVPAKAKPDATVPSVCGYCSTGCALDVHLRGGEAVNLTPRAAYPVNLGMACPKGWEALRVLDATDRATTPLARDASGELRPVDWAEAMRRFTSGMRAVEERHGAEAMAFLGTGQISTEEMGLLGALAKFGMGMVHGDGNTRQCMATAVTAYKETFGFDAPPYTYRDFEESDVLVFVGANPCIGHPILWERVLRNRRSPEIVVVDPRRTETAIAATRHVAIRPKTDLALFWGLVHLAIARGDVDEEFVRAHTSGFEKLARRVEEWTPERVARECGIEEAELRRLAELIGGSERVSFWWTMGVNQSYEGVATAEAIIALALITGNIGRPGTGANSITGQCNAMGSRLFSNTTNLLGGHDFADPDDRAKVAGILGIGEERIPLVSGDAYSEILERVRDGRVRALWIIATNTAHSWIDRDDARELLRSLDFLVVQDMYHSTETARLADLVLPAAGWGEKDGTFVNSERRIGRIRKVKRAPGQALSDFSIFRLVADAWGVGEMFREWSSPEAAFRILRELSRGQPCDFTGIDGYDMLDEHGGVQWPCPEGEELGDGERRLFEDGRFFHQNGRARLIYTEPRSDPEPPDDEYPLYLLTGRGTVSQWHTQTRTAKSPVLRKLYPAEAYVEMHPRDAERHGVVGGERIELRSRRGAARVRVEVTPTVAPGQVFVPMHYEETNRLTLSHFDPKSRQPSYKDAAVKVVKLESA